MTRNRSKLITVVLTVAVAWGVFRLGQRIVSDDDTRARDVERVVNQVWLERLPTSHRDMIGHFALVDHPRGKLGLVGKSSRWRHHLELFGWSLKGDQLTVFFPQDETTARVRVRTWSCPDQAPPPLTLCMEVANKHRKMVYYSHEDLVIEPHARPSLHLASDSALGTDYPALTGVLEQLVSASATLDSGGSPGIDGAGYREIDELPMSRR